MSTITFSQGVATPGRPRSQWAVRGQVASPLQPLKCAAGSQGKHLDSQGCGFLTAHTVLVLVPCCYSSRLSYRLSLTSKEIFTPGWSCAAVSRHNISAVSFSSASWFLFHELRHSFVGNGCSRKLLFWRPLFTACLAVTTRDLEMQRQAVVVTMAALMNHSGCSVWWCHRSWPGNCLCLALRRQTNLARGLCDVLGGWESQPGRCLVSGMLIPGCKQQLALPDLCCCACVPPAPEMSEAGCKEGGSGLAGPVAVPMYESILLPASPWCPFLTWLSKCSC